MFFVGTRLTRPKSPATTLLPTQGNRPMRNLHNIEKSGFHKGEYVGYGAGRVYRIRKWRGGWHGRNAEGTDIRMYDTLAQWSLYLADIRA